MKPNNTPSVCCGRFEVLKMRRSWMIKNFPSSFPFFFNHFPHPVPPAYYPNILILASHVTSLFIQLSYHLTTLLPHSEALFSAWQLRSILASITWHLEPWSFFSHSHTISCCAVSPSTTNPLDCPATLSPSFRRKSFPRFKNYGSAPAALVLTFVSLPSTISAVTTRHLQLSIRFSPTIAFETLYIPTSALEAFVKATSRSHQFHLLTSYYLDIPNPALGVFT